MVSQCNASIALLLSINFLLFSLVSSYEISPSPAPNPKPAPTLRTPTPFVGKCPRNALKLGVCADVLKLVDGVVVGAPPTLPCCSLLKGLVNLQAAVCLCTAIRANLLGIKLNFPIALSLVLNNCGRQSPNGFECI